MGSTSTIYLEALGLYVKAKEAGDEKELDRLTEVLDDIWYTMSDDEQNHVELIVRESLLSQ